MKRLFYAAAFIFNPQGHLLCTEEVHEFDNAPHWMIPGGGMEEGETPEQAAAREVLEETGTQVTGTAQRLFEIVMHFPDAVITAYGVHFPGCEGELKPLDPEITCAAFLPLSKVRAEVSATNNPMRIDPIMHVLDQFEKSGACDFFCWEYRDGKRL